MAVGTQKPRRKMPSFSSSLLDAIYHSIDDETPHPPPPLPSRRNAAARVDEEIESLRRAIMVEKWMENHNHTHTTPKSMHLPSNSSSSSSSSSCIFTSSETESSSTPKPKPDRFTRTKSRAMKIYGDLKKVKEPISPGGRIANFLNSIFSPRNLKKDNSEWSSVRKSRSMKDTTTTSSRSCLTSTNNSNPNSSRNVSKSKRSVRFCPVLDEDSRVYGGVGSRFIKKNMESIRVHESEQRDFDEKSCASSDLFELENIGAYDQELPVYGTTDLKMNRAIASGFIL